MLVKESLMENFIFCVESEQLLDQMKNNFPGLLLFIFILKYLVYFAVWLTHYVPVLRLILGWKYMRATLALNGLNTPISKDFYVNHNKLIFYFPV